MIRPSNGIISYQKYIFYFLLILKFPFLTEETPKFVHLLWECLSWISVFIPLHLSMCHFIELHKKLHTESIDYLLNVGIQGVWLVCSCVTMLNYKLTSKRLGDMLNEIDTTFHWRSAKGKTYVTLEKCYKYAKYVSVGWQSATVSLVVLNFVRPLWSRPLLLPSVNWYPLNLNNPFNFTLAYILQCWAQLIVVCCFNVGSTLFCSFSFLCCGQFNILRCSFKNLVFTSGIYKRFPETLELTNVPADSADYLFAKEIDDTLLPITRPTSGAQTLHPKGGPTLTLAEVETFRKALVNCVNHHLQVQKVCGHMEAFFNFFAFLRVFEITAQMCFMAFVYSKTSDFFIFLYGLFAGFDLFLQTYPAEHILYQNNLIGTSIMLGPWYLVAKYFRNDFLIILTCTRRPVRFTAGKILFLNADRLRLALGAAFSYYTLISNLDKKRTE